MFEEVKMSSDRSSPRVELVTEDGVDTVGEVVRALVSQWSEEGKEVEFLTVLQHYIVMLIREYKEH